MLKKIALATVGAMVIGSIGFAADAENTDTTKTDVSKNPITGTVTKKTTRKQKVKGAHGDAELKTVEKTKTHKDGTVETSQKVDGEAEQK